MNNKGNKNEKTTGCFIITFLITASGIPSVLAHAEEGPIGSTVILIFGVVVAWYVAKALSDN